MTEEEKQIIETIDDDGNVIKFELFDIIEFENKEYALLLPPDSDEEEDEVVLMHLLNDGDGYVFETIEDDEEFERVSEYISNLDDDEDEE